MTASQNAVLTPKLLRRQIIDAVRGAATVPPRCPHAPPAGMCGGCTFQAYSYPAQIDAKLVALRLIWADSSLPAIGFVASPDAFAYRTRMDFVASKSRFGLRRGGKFNYIIDLDQCHLIPERAFVAARALYDRAVALGLPDYNLHSHEGFVRYIVVRRSPDDRLLLSIVTAAPEKAGVDLAALEDLAATALAQDGVVAFHWLINDTLTDLSFGEPRAHWGSATLPMVVGDRTLQIGPNTFFQNNIHLLLPLLEDVAVEVVAAGRPERVADLYGGVGTIALHLAESVGQITSVESVGESAALAQQNIADNGCANVRAVHADVLDFLRTQTPGSFDVLVADPPRTGLGPEVCAEVLRLRPARIVYVSCNPITQHEDAQILAAGYTLERLTGYDMFPQTPHMEALGVFSKKLGD